MRSVCRNLALALAMITALFLLIRIETWSGHLNGPQWKAVTGTIRRVDHTHTDITTDEMNTEPPPTEADMVTDTTGTDITTDEMKIEAPPTEGDIVSECRLGKSCRECPNTSS